MSHAFLTTREVADLLRVKERKVYDMAAEGEIPHRRVTGKLLFPKAELEAWLAGGAQTDMVPDVIAGSHDPLLDWAIRESGSGLATFFDGSLDGLERMVQGKALAAGMHVFEPAAQDWNRAHVAQALSGQPVVLVEWARRAQGLILPPDSPVRAVADLAGKRIVQRQSSAGAGLLLSHLLEQAGLLDLVDWVADCARTETEAAAAVASGQADAAPGLSAMAAQFGLGFVPTIQERFDLIVDRRSWFQPAMQRLIGFARTDGFADKAASLGGYDVSGMGTVHWNA